MILNGSSIINIEVFDVNQIIESSETRHGASCAIYTDDYNSRVFLSRIWGKGELYVNFIMLNPSTATHTQLDPTVTRCYNWGKAWGFDGIFITNIFALRSTDPKNLYVVNNPKGSGNDKAIGWTARKSSKIIAAWGRHGLLHNRSSEVLEILKNHKIYGLKLTKDGIPGHPLYLPSNSKPFPLNE